jgi:hypothetical protein
MMKKIGYLSCVFVLLLVSCSDNNSVDSIEDSVLVTKIISTNSLSQESITDYYYSENKIIKSVNNYNGVSKNYTYNGNSIVKCETVIDNSNQIIQSKQFFYNSSSKLSKVIFLDYENNYGSRKEYEYANNNTILFKVYTGNLTTQDNFYYSGDYILQNNNCIISHFYSTDIEGNPTTRTHNFTYDTKNSPMKNIVGYNKIAIDDSPYGIINNYTYYSSISTNVVSEYNQTITYEYDDNNFPTSSESINNSGYFYQNQFFYN